MRISLRQGLIVAALIATGGCASKRPAPEIAPASPPQPSGTQTSSTAPTAFPPGEASQDAGSRGAQSRATATGSAIPVARAQTREERRDVLDKQLNDSLGSFDARLRKEQQKIAQERDALQATVVAATTSDASGTSGTDQASGDDAGSLVTESPGKRPGPHGDAAGKRGESRSAGSGDLRSEKNAGNGNANGAVANEIPDGSDDDIVARRLRKAAEQETDPELKDKLWKEYLQYKNNAQGK